mmetsp:Transcript_14841/g.39594  ORF Transcript_14841/g.39594 Transcript_14841/m.39594 type:complete len:223 (+) Transcript_14841:790-1458(+)
MPFRRALISSARVAMLSSVSSIAFSRSLSLMSSTFFSSSAVSSSFSQYAFFASSEACSSPSSATMLSIILRTLSKLLAPPRSAREMSATRGSWLLTLSRAFKAAVCTSLLVTCSCISVGVGRVFLKSSKASSSLRILMVSARARSSSVRVFERSSHSAVFVSQPFSSSAKNFLSASRAFAVSSKSSFMLTISTASSPEAESFDSISVVRASISAVLAALKAS